MQALDPFLHQITQACQACQVKHLYVFGSILRDDFAEDSDVDLIVDFTTADPFEYADNYFNLKDALEGIFKRDVDLLDDRALRNPYFIKAIEHQKQLLYAA